MTLRRPGAIVAVLAASALMVGGLSACGSDDTAADTAAATAAATATSATSATSSTTDTTQKVGGTATCDADSLVEAAKGADPDVTGLDTPDGFKCADGWAYAFVDVGTGDTAYAATMVFEAEGQFWIPKDRAEVCKAPGDQVPASLYQMACETN